MLDAYQLAQLKADTPPAPHNDADRLVQPKAALFDPMSLKHEVLASPTSIIEPTTTTTEHQSLEPKQLRFATDAPNELTSPEPESIKLADVESGSMQLKTDTAHGVSKVGEYVKLPKFDASFSLEPAQSLAVNTHDAILRTPEPFVATVLGTLWEEV